MLHPLSSCSRRTIRTAAAPSRSQKNVAIQTLPILRNRLLRQYNSKSTALSAPIHTTTYLFPQCTKYEPPTPPPTPLLSHIETTIVSKNNNTEDESEESSDDDEVEGVGKVKKTVVSSERKSKSSVKGKRNKKASEAAAAAAAIVEAEAQVQVEIVAADEDTRDEYQKKVAELFEFDTEGYVLLRLLLLFSLSPPYKLTPAPPYTLL